MTIEVVLVTQSACDLCERASSVLDRLGAEYDLNVRTASLTTPEGEALARRGGMLFPPGLLIDDEPFSYGRVSERKLRREFARRTTTPSS